MIYLFKETVFNCRQATLLSIKREQGAITLFERLKLSYHLLYCNPCRRFVNQSQQIDQRGLELDQKLFSQPPFRLSAQAKDRMQKIVESL